MIYLIYLYDVRKVPYMPPTSLGHLEADRPLLSAVPQKWFKKKNEKTDAQKFEVPQKIVFPYRGVPQKGLPTAVQGNICTKTQLLSLIHI